METLVHVDGTGRLWPDVTTLVRRTNPGARGRGAGGGEGDSRAGRVLGPWGRWTVWGAVSQQHSRIGRNHDPNRTGLQGPATPATQSHVTGKTVTHWKAAFCYGWEHGR